MFALERWDAISERNAIIIITSVTIEYINLIKKYIKLVIKSHKTDKLAYFTFVSGEYIKFAKKN